MQTVFLEEVSNYLEKCNESIKQYFIDPQGDKYKDIKAVEVCLFLFKMSYYFLMWRNAL